MKRCREIYRIIFPHAWNLAIFLIVQRWHGHCFASPRVNQPLERVMYSHVYVVLGALAGIVLFAGNALAGTPTISVPEPGTAALIAGGIGALAVARFRRRRK